MKDKNKRIKNLSTRYLFVWKGFVLLVCLSLVLMIVYLEYITPSGEPSIHFIISGLWIFSFFKLMIIHYRVYHVEFDEDYLYLIQTKQDILIPLENIDYVEIVSALGIYKIKLMDKIQIGDVCYFKPSLWYPLNFKTKDKLVDYLRYCIDRAKQKKVMIEPNRLHS